MRIKTWSRQHVLIVALFFFLGAPLMVHAFDTNELLSLLNDSYQTWELSAHLSPSLPDGTFQPIDATPIVTRVDEDLKVQAGADFRYLIEMARSAFSKQQLVLFSTTFRPVLPGINAMVTNTGNWFLIVNETEYTKAGPESPLIRASFLRAVATIYYALQPSSLSLTFGKRNVANEFLGLMSGLWVEALFKRNLMGLTTDKWDNDEWNHFLLASDQSDRLGSVASTMFGLRMESMYQMVQNAKVAVTPTDTLSMLEGISGYSDQLEHGLSVYMNTIANSLTGDNTIINARTMLVFGPWVVLRLACNPAAADPAVDAALTTLTAKLKALSLRFHRVQFYGYSQVIQARNAIKTTSPDSACPVQTSLSLATASTSLENTKKELWFSRLYFFDTFSIVGFVPLSREEALATAAYRLSYDDRDRLTGVDFFLRGQLRYGDDLSCASLRFSYQENKTLVACFNQFGKPATAEYAWQTCIQEQQNSAFKRSFYAPDGRRVPDFSGAWTVLIQNFDSVTQEFTLLDSCAVPVVLANGFSGYRFAKADKTTINLQFLDLNKNPVPRESDGVSVVNTTIQLEALNAVVTTRFFDTKGLPMATRNSEFVDRETFYPDHYTKESFDAKGVPFLNNYGYAKSVAWFDKGVLRDLYCYGVQSEPVLCNDGYFHVAFELKERMEPLAARALDTAEKPIEDIFGVHCRETDYNTYGQMVEIRNFDRNKRPVDCLDGYARMRWSFDTDGAATIMGVWNADGVSLTPTDTKGL